MEYEEFVRRFNERAKKRAAEFEKATAKAQSDVDRIVAEARKHENSDTEHSRVSPHHPRTAPKQEETPARRHRRVQGILKQM